MGPIIYIICAGMVNPMLGKGSFGCLALYGCGKKDRRSLRSHLIVPPMGSLEAAK